MERREQTRRCTRGTIGESNWCPWCYENAKGRAAHRGHAHCHSRVIRRATFQEYTVQRPQGPKPPKKGEFSCPDNDFKKAYPMLSQGMSDEFWDDGKQRDPWTLKISMSCEGVLLTLNDKSSKLVSFTTSLTVEGGFQVIEDALRDGTISWRKSKW